MTSTNHLRSLYGVGLLLFGILLAAGSSEQSLAAGKSLVVAIESEVTTLEAHLTTDMVSTSVRRHLYNLLVDLYADTLEFSPELAEKWESSPDGKTYTFFLKKGVKFHDGSPCNAEAVKFNFDRLIHPKRSSAAKNNVEMIDRVEVVDEYTVRFILKSAFGPFLNYLNHPGAGAIMSMEALKKYGDQIGINPVGTGPYKFVRWLKGSDIVLERFEGYWGKKPYFDQIIFKPVPEDASRVMMLETGEADVAHKVPPYALPQLKENKDITVLNSPCIAEYTFRLNCMENPTNDVRVRKAINYAVNKEEINKKLLNSSFVIANSPVPEGVFGHVAFEPFEYNPTKAKELLKEAGYTGKEIIMWSPKGKYPMDTEIAQMVQNYLQAIGMKVNLTIWGDYPAYLAAPGKFDIKHNLKMMSWSATPMDADSALWQLYHSSLVGKNSNFSNYDNKEFDNLLEQSRNTLDQGERKNIFKKTQEILWRDAPSLWLFRQAYIVGTRKDIQGVYLRPSQHLYLMDAYRK